MYLQICRQALTEISVLSDVIQIAQHQQKYVALDPVVTSPSGSASPAYQYFVKKKALCLAAEILQKGTKSLSLSSTEKEREFHKALSSLRERWRLKRMGSGAIVGDLSYHSGRCSFGRNIGGVGHVIIINNPAGSAYIGAVPFDVTKHKPSEAGTGTPADSATDVIAVTIPREWRGRSEVLVFLSPEPVRGQLGIISIQPCGLCGEGLAGACVCPCL